MDLFKPVEIREYYINRIASGMSKYFYNNIFEPIFKILKDTSVINSKELLINALKSGKIYYKNGAFRTQERFSNAVSQTLESMGAVFKNGAYFINEALIPLEYLQAISIAQTMTATKLYAVKKFLDNYVFSADDLKQYIETAATEMFKTLERDIIQSAQEKNMPIIDLGIVNPKTQEVDKAKIKEIQDYWKNVDKQIKDLNDKKKNAEQQEEARKDKNKGKGKNSANNPPPAISSADLQQKINEINETAFENAPKVEINDTALDKQSRKIAEDYTYNMRYWVKKWEAKNIIKMREDVLNMVKSGQRIDEIQKYFDERWNIAKNKAFFLAKNESNIAASVIKKTEYQKMGCSRFKWERSSAKEKRKLHEKYYDKIFYFDNPPIIDERTGQTGLPRQTYNCLCHMRFVVPTMAELTAQRAKAKGNKTILGKIKNAIFNGKQYNNNAWKYRRFDQRAAV